MRRKSPADLEVLLSRKNRTAEADQCCPGHVVTENRHGLLVNVRVTQAWGQAVQAVPGEMERDIPDGSKRVALAAATCNLLRIRNPPGLAERAWARTHNGRPGTARDVGG